MYPKKVRFAGVNYGILELTQEFPGVNRNFVILNFYLSQKVDRDLVQQVLEDVFKLSDLQVLVFKEMNGVEFFQLCYTIPTMVRRMSNYIHAKARQIARKLYLRLEVEVPLIYDSFIEHCASEYPRYVPEEASQRAYRNGQIDHTGRIIL